jgi:hypothetical protein
MKKYFNFLFVLQEKYVNSLLVFDCNGRRCFTKSDIHQHLHLFNDQDKATNTAFYFS